MTVCPDCGYHPPPQRGDEERPWWNPHAEFAGLVLLIDQLTYPSNQHGRCGQTYSTPSESMPCHL